MKMLYEGEYLLYVPHNVAELIHYCGSPDRFEQRLDTLPNGTPDSIKAEVIKKAEILRAKRYS